MSYESEHDWFLQRIADAIEHRLDDDEQRSFDAHARSCESCAAELRDSKQLETDMTALFSTMQPDAMFESRLISRLRAGERMHWVHPLVRKAAIAAAAAIVFGGFGYVANQRFSDGTMPFWISSKIDQRVKIASLVDGAREIVRSEIVAGVSATTQPADHMYGAFSGPQSGARRWGFSSGVALKDGDADFQPPRKGGFDGNDSVNIPAEDVKLGESFRYAPAGNEAEVSNRSTSGEERGKAGSDKNGAWGVPSPQAQYFGLSDFSGRLASGESATGVSRGTSGIPGKGVVVAGKPVTTFGEGGELGINGSAPARPQFESEKVEDLYAGALVVPIDGKNDATVEGGAAPQNQGQQQNAPPNPPENGANHAPPPNVAPEAAARKIIRNGELEFEVDSFDTAAATVSKIVTEESGYISTTNSQKLPNGKVKGAIIVRVAPEKLDTLILKLRALGDLKRQNLTAADVTKQYYDLSAELRAAKAMQDRLIEIIKTGKGEVKDLLNVEKELAVWRGKAEKLEGELRFYDNQVSLSTLAVNLYERDIRTAAAIKEIEQADAGIEVEDVEKARAEAIKAVEEAKGRIIEAELKKFDAGQLAAKVIADVPPENAGQVIDRLKQLGKVARLEVQRKQTTSDGNAPQASAKVEKGETRIVASFYNLANIQPRQSVSLQLACDDVEMVYASVLSMVEKSSGRVITSNLQRPQPDVVNGTIQFELPANLADAELMNLRAMGSPMQLTVSENPDTANVTSAKRGFHLSLIAASNVAPRQTVRLDAETNDVPQATTAVQNAIAGAGAKLVSTNQSAASNAARNVMVIDLPAGKLDALLTQIDASAKVKSRQSRLETQIPDGPAARARIELQLSTPDTIVSGDSGFWKSIRNGLSTSFAGLLWSVQLIVIGVCLVAPWALLLWVGWKVFRKRRPAAV